MKTGITLLTMGAGNVKVLKDTLGSFKNVCDEVIYGDLLLFPEDREIVKGYQKEYNLKIVPFKFDYLFHNGFSSLLNVLASRATNDIVVYMNTSEIIDEDYGIVESVKSNQNCNAFFFIHRTDPHRWYRMYNRRELKWSGRLHEQLEGDYRPYHKPIFMMADLEKDLDSPLKAKVLNDVKEIVYFRNYMSIVEAPDSLGATDSGWVKFATENYDSMQHRLLKKGKRYEAFFEGDFKKYMMDVYSNPEFEKERFESSNLIAFQGDKIHLL